MKSEYWAEEVLQECKKREHQMTTAFLGMLESYFELQFAKLQILLQHQGGSGYPKLKCKYNFGGYKPTGSVIFKLTLTRRNC